MMQEDKTNIIKELRKLGFKPREDKNINNYIKQLNARLGKKGKQLKIYYNPITIQIIDKPKKVVRNKKLFARVTEEEMKRYKELAEIKGTNISNIIRDILNFECDRLEL